MSRESHPVSTATSTGATSAGAVPPGGSVAPANGPIVNVDTPPPSLPAVGWDEPVSSDNGLSVRVVSVRGISAQGNGRGQVSGPALALTVRVTNDSADAVSLNGLEVNVAFGRDQTPASPVDDPSASPLGGSLGSHDSAEGRYTFTVPTDARDTVTATIGLEADSPRLVFTGRVD